MVLIMKRFHDGAYGDSALEKKNALSQTIKSLTASQSDGTLPNDQATVPPRKLSRHEDFVHRIHRMLARSKGNIYEAQRTDTEVQEKGSILELKNQIEILKNQIEILGKQFEKLEGQNKCEHRLESNILERTSVPFPGTKLIGKRFEWNSAKIIGWLKNSGASTIGVWGMGGIGKTALLKHICNQLVQDNTFSADVYWLTVSECDAVYKWQASIAKCFGFDFSNEEDELKRAMVLHRKLAKKGSIVLILDDMWQPFIPDEVGISPRENGWRIILSTRSLEVCRRMGCKDLIIKLTVFSISGEERMKLFVDKLEGYSALTEEVKTTAKEIVKRCGGLPLAIITMSYCMKGVTAINEWGTLFMKSRFASTVT